MIDKFFTIDELKNTGLRMALSVFDRDIPIGEKVLCPSVISMWDCTDYSDYFTYFNEIDNKHTIKFVVDICVKTSEKHGKIEHLKKDLSNI